MSAGEGNKWGCSESVSGRHSPARADGRCDWCGKRATFDPPPSPGPDGWEPSDLTEAYGYHYEPDYGAESLDQIRNRYQTGRDS
jgi:hypothetical protein